MVLWGAVSLAPPAQAAWPFPLMALAWTLAEVTRYSFYLCTLLTGSSPAVLTWLRYSLFYILYPAGIAGEVLCLWNSLPTIAANRIGEVPLPNAHNLAFSWHTVLWGLLLLGWAPGSVIMMSHMMRQRAAVLGGGSKTKKQ